MPVTLEPPPPSKPVWALDVLGRDALTVTAIVGLVQVALGLIERFDRGRLPLALAEEVGLFYLLGVLLVICFEALARFVRFARKRPYPSMSFGLLVFRGMLSFPLVFPFQLLYSALVRVGALALAVTAGLLGVGYQLPPDSPFGPSPHGVWWWFLALPVLAGIGLAYAGRLVYRSAKLRRWYADCARKLEPTPCAGQHGPLVLVEGTARRACDDRPSLEDASVLLRSDRHHPERSRCRAFEVEDESGRTRVDPGTDAALLADALDLSPDGSVRPDVEVLREGERVWVLGHPVGIHESAAVEGEPRWRIEPARISGWKPQAAEVGFEPWERRLLRWGGAFEPVFRIGAPPRVMERLPSARGAYPRLALSALCLLLSAGLAARGGYGMWNEYRVGALAERYPLYAEPGEAEAAPLMEALADGYAPLRHYAARALCAHGRNQAQTVPALIAALDDPYREVREAAIQALSERRAFEALPALLKAGVRREPALLFECFERDLRYPVLMALERFDVRHVAPLQEQGGFRERVLALELLACRGQAGHGYIHVPLVLEALASCDSHERWVGSVAQDRLDPYEPALALNLLKRLREARGAELEELLGEARWDRVETPEAARELGRIVREGPLEVRLRALYALRRMGAAAKEALPEVAACVNDAPHESAWAAMQILQDQGPAAAEHTGSLVGVLLSPRYSLHDAAVEALLAIGPPVREAVEAARLGAPAASLARLDQVLLKLPNPPTLRPGQPVEAEPLPAEAANTLALEGVLLFDGKPVTELTPAAPEVKLYDRTNQKWLRQEPVLEGHRFRFEALGAGEYQLHASIDRLVGGGRMGPEDLWEYQIVTLKREGNLPVELHLQQGIRLLEPVDLGEQAKVFPLLGSRVRFAWKPVATGVNYSLYLYNSSLNHRRHEQTAATELTLDLDPGQYQMNLYADRDRKRLGALRTILGDNRNSMAEWRFTSRLTEGEPQSLALDALYGSRPLLEVTPAVPEVKVVDRVGSGPVPATVRYEGSLVWLERLPPGVYGIHAEVALPAGDPQGAGAKLEGSAIVLVKPGAAKPPGLHFSRTIFLREPEDTAKHVLAFTPPLNKPAAIPSPVRLRWDGLGEGVEYHYALYGAKTQNGKISETTLQLELPPGRYTLSLSAYRNGHFIGRLRVTGPNQEHPHYHFIVKE